MKKILINISVGIICLFTGAISAKYILDLFKFINFTVLMCIGILVFIAMVIFFFYKMFTLFEDVFSDDQETWGINKWKL